MKIKIELPKDIAEIIADLKKAGFEAYAVGGCIRDSLLGVEPKDWDITTNATPEQVKTVFEGVFDSFENNGEKFGTVCLKATSMNVEVTTYRKEGVYEDGRHPKEISYAKTIEEDLMRRDFTINAIAYDGEKIIAVENALNDLDSKIIRTVGTPEKRFEEDALRMLRAVRFASALGFDIEAKTKEAIHDNVFLLSKISAERKQKEFNGILQGFYVEKPLLEFSDVISQIAPKIESCIGFEQNNPYHRHNVYDHIVAVIKETKPDLETRLAAFFHDIGKPLAYSEEIKDGKIRGHFYGHPTISTEICIEQMKELKYPAETISNVAWLVEKHDTKFVANKKNVKRLLNACNGNLELFGKLLDLKLADRKDHTIPPDEMDFEKLHELKEEIIKEQETFSLKDLEIDGYDMIKLGLKGKEIGNALNYAFEKVLNEELPNNKETLLSEIEKEFQISESYETDEQ